MGKDVILIGNTIMQGLCQSFFLVRPLAKTGGIAPTFLQNGSAFQNLLLWVLNFPLPPLSNLCWSPCLELLGKHQ